MTFNNQTYLITGGANGIGLAVAKALYARGAKLALSRVGSNENSS